MDELASYTGPFTCTVHAGREKKAWYQSFVHALNFTWIPCKIVFFGIF